MADHDTHDHTGIPGCGGGLVVEDYVEQATPLAITATSEATAQAFVTGAGFSAAGSTDYMVECFIPTVYAAAGQSVDLWLYDGSSSIGHIAQIYSSLTTIIGMPVHVMRKVTPSAGTKTYSIRVSSSNAAGSSVYCGAGGTATLMPAFIRVTKT
jgi:hypothetical protein